MNTRSYRRHAREGGHPRDFLINAVQEEATRQSKVVDARLRGHDAIG